MMSQKEGLSKREDLEWDNSSWDCGRPPSDWAWVLSPPRTEAVFRHGHLYAGAIEFVYALAEIGDVVVVTKRPKAATRVTLDWLRFMFDRDPFPLSEVHILGDDRQKSEIPADVYIDDNRDNIEELFKNTGAALVLVKRPWNQNGEGDYPVSVHQTETFEEALEAVQEVKGWMGYSKKPTL